MIRNIDSIPNVGGSFIEETIEAPFEDSSIDVVLRRAPGFKEEKWGGDGNNVSTVTLLGAVMVTALGTYLLENWIG